MLYGKRFHNVAAATGNALSPHVLYLCMYVCIYVYFSIYYRPY